MILSSAAKYGKAASLRATTEHIFGPLMYALASATDLSVLLLTHQCLFGFAQLAGAALLLFIAFGPFVKPSSFR